MALPQSLDGLAQYLGKADLKDLLVTCFYCGKLLTETDKIIYENCNLGIIWVEGAYYACCYCCTLSTARLDFMLNYERVACAEEIELQTTGGISSLTVRCLRCLRDFNRHEKRDLLQSNSDIYIIRGEHRAVCVVCRIGL